MTIVPFLKDNVFGPQDIQAMSTAFEEVCNILNMADHAKSGESCSRRRSSPLRPGTSVCRVSARPPTEGNGTGIVPAHRSCRSAAGGPL